MYFKTIMAAAAVAVTTMVASVAGAAPLTNIDAGVVADGTTTNVGPLNITNHRFRIEGKTADLNGGSGSLTVDTFVDPFIANGNGAANILFSGAAASVTGDWGGQVINFMLVGTSWIADPITTIFAGSGPAFSQLLTVNWTGADANSQISVVVEAVPVPAGILLMGTALAGFGVMRRRKKVA